MDGFKQLFVNCSNVFLQKMSLAIQCEGFLLGNADVRPRKDQYFYNDVVRFSCPTGHLRVGPLSAQCYHFGWSPPPPICKGGYFLQVLKKNKI